MLKLQQDALKIFLAGVKAVSPYVLVSKKINVSNDELSIDDRNYRLNHNVHVAAFGKAVLGMVNAIENILSAHIVQGIVSVPCGMDDASSTFCERNVTGNLGSRKYEIFKGAKNNLPDENSHIAARKIMEMAKTLDCHDILLVLITGGGSALLSLPVPQITLEEKVKATKVLSNKGATIEQLNTVRKHLSLIKGGKLAQAAYPASVIALILSDVIDDPIDVIACGPTAPDLTTKTDCVDIVNNLDASNDLPASIMNYLNCDEQVETSSVDFNHVYNVIVGNNVNAIEGASLAAQELGYKVEVYNTTVRGEAREVGKLYAKLAHMNSSCGDDEKQSKKSLCIISSGETTVFVQGSGRGGRNQELALAAAIEMDKLPKFKRNALLLSAGTDGQDGPTPAAGAYAFQNLITNATEDGLDPLTHLNYNDTFTFYNGFKGGEYLVKTGLTGTNVMDLHILLFS